MLADMALDDGEMFSEAERNRLVRLCARLGSPHVAEDLAQEALLEAWRSRERLRDPASRTQWLSGIARNICRRWQRRQGSGGGRGQYGLTIDGAEIHVEDDADLQIVLEQSEVADLLGRALDLIPGAARELLVERYVDDLPVTEMATRRGITEGTAAVRLHRGRRALMRILSTELRPDAFALGLLEGTPETWQGTRIWCPNCGQARLEAQREGTTFAVRCPNCGHVTSERGAAYLAGVKGYWRTLLLAHREADRYFRAALAGGSAPCACCGRESRLQYSIPPALTGRDRDTAGVSIRCEGCDAVSMQPDLGLALTHPSVRRFWRDHKRMRMAARREIESGGREAILVQFESVGAAASIEVVAAANTFEVLHVGGAGAREVHG